MENHKINAPFTDEQVEKLNKFQTNRVGHPFTCGVCRDADVEKIINTLDEDEIFEAIISSSERKLVATNDGWICPNCDYTQDWAWAIMVSMADQKDIFQIAKEHRQQNEKKTEAS